MPAPSPVLASQPQAPRCSRLRSSSRPCATIECEAFALQMDDEADAAGVPLVLRVAQTLCVWRLRDRGLKSLVGLILHGSASGADGLVHRARMCE